MGNVGSDFTRKKKNMWNAKDDITVVVLLHQCSCILFIILPIMLECNATCVKDSYISEWPNKYLCACVMSLSYVTRDPQDHAKTAEG